MSALAEVEQYRSDIDLMRSLATSNPRINILGKEFLIYPGAFHPGPWSDCIEALTKDFLEEFKEELTKKAEEESFDFLEVGCGAGYASILAALASQKCHVLATDINETAVENTIENVKLHGVDDRVKAVTADVFNHEIFAGKKFDMIYWDFPWFGDHTEPGTDLDPLFRSLIDPKHEGLRRYLLEGDKYLKKTGRILVGFSFNCGSKEMFDKVVNETGWIYKICRSTSKIPLEIAGGEQQEIETCIVEFLKQE